MKNNNNIELEPSPFYWEAIFSSFSKIKKLSNFFKQKDKDINQDNSLIKLFYNLCSEKKTLKECVKEFQKIIISKNKKDLLLNPKSLFNFLLNELHNELKNIDKKNEEHIPKLKRQNEFNEDNAYNDFKNYSYKNISFIQQLFFGTKKITKTCQYCNRRSYDFNFLNFIPINIQNITGTTKLEYLYDNIQREFEKKINCFICKTIQNFKIKIDITNTPEILIIFLFNHQKNVKIEFPYELSEKEEKYKLKSLVMANENSSILNNLLNKKNNINLNFISYVRKKGKFFVYIENNLKYIEKEIIDKGIPYILFYKRKKEKTKDKNSFDDTNSKEDMIFPKINSNYQNENKITSNKFTFEKEKKNENKKNNTKNLKDEYNKSEIEENKNLFNKYLERPSEYSNINSNNNFYFDNYTNDINNNINNNKIINNNLNSNNINNNMRKNKNSENKGNIIVLYFKFKNGNIFPINVDNNMTFENIKIELKKKYHHLNFEDENLFINEKIIDDKETPRKIGIKNGSYIDVTSDLIE